jgi:hypothetical protein
LARLLDAYVRTAASATPRRSPIKRSGTVHNEGNSFDSSEMPAIGSPVGRQTSLSASGLHAGREQNRRRCAAPTRAAFVPVPLFKAKGLQSARVHEIGAVARRRLMPSQHP